MHELTHVFSIGVALHQRTLNRFRIDKQKGPGTLQKICECVHRYYCCKGLHQCDPCLPGNPVIQQDLLHFMIQSVPLTSFGKEELSFTLVSVPTGKRLEGKQSTLPVVQDLSKSKSSKVTSTSAGQMPTSDSAMFASHPVNPSRQLPEELAVAGVDIQQVKQIIFRYWEQPDPTTGLPSTHDFWLKCPLF